MKQIHRFVLPISLSLVFLVFVSLPVTSLPSPALALEQYQGVCPVIVVFYRSSDEPRAFSFNLALSTEWDRIESRNIKTVDVGPGRYDLDTIANKLGIGTTDFAVVALGLHGDVLYRTNEADSLAQLLKHIDLERNRDHSSLTGKNP
ncbi:MAG: hypothetical protein WCY01_05135 [Alkalispirochaeta sp.]